MSCECWKNVKQLKDHGFKIVFYCNYHCFCYRVPLWNENILLLSPFKWKYAHTMTTHFKFILFIYKSRKIINRKHTPLPNPVIFKMSPHYFILCSNNCAPFSPIHAIALSHMASTVTLFHSVSLKVFVAFKIRLRKSSKWIVNNGLVNFALHYTIRWKCISVYSWFV